VRGATPGPRGTSSGILKHRKTAKWVDQGGLKKTLWREKETQVVADSGGGEKDRGLKKIISAERKNC